MFNATTASATPSSAHVVLAVPSLIGGRPDLTYEMDLNANAMGFAVPEGILARRGTVSLTPLSPANQQSPPFSFAIDTLAQNNTLTIPTDNVWLHGFVHDALDLVPSATFVARAYQQNRLVSNLAIITPRDGTNADGSFRLAIPAAAMDGPVTVELSPQSAASDPSFVSEPWPLASLDMGTVNLPTYQTPQTFLATVEGDHGEAIDTAFVRAATELTPQAGGTTRFSQDGQTGAGTGTPPGTLKLSLIPGTGKTARSYDVAVIPAPGTPFAVTCTSWPVNGGGTDASPTALPKIVVPRRPLITGSVTNASGSPVASVVVTASRAPETARVCETTNAAATGPTTISTTTNATGGFALALDNGSYQLDFDPPSGSGMPRFSQYNLAVIDQDVPLGLIVLPPPALIEGQVSDASGMPIANATIRVFESRCAAGMPCKIPPILHGETQTDDTGHFRAVVAVPPPAN
jgi:hypothetical protein